jgi:5-methyltetrahydrofolate--homocysteine methyltransferase
MLMQRGFKLGEAPESYNISKPYILEEIAALYLAAGAEISTTNTFGASPLRLKQFSLDKEMEEINRSAVAAVRKAVGDKAYVSASIGPSAKMMKPHGDAEPDELLANYQQQAKALLAAKPDMVCIETMADPIEAALAIKAVREQDREIPIMATMTFNKTPKGFFTYFGASISDSIKALEKAGANIIGSNCGNGMDNMVGIAQEFRRQSRLPIAIQGNAGLPVETAAGLVYSESPAFFAQKAVELLNLGVQIMGGCCGVNPDHIREIRNAVDNYRR